MSDTSANNKTSTSNETTSSGNDTGSSGTNDTGSSGGNDTGSSGTNDTGSSGGNDTGSSGASESKNFTRPTSYFSNVRSKAYRSGWHDVFGDKKKSSGKSGGKAKKKVGNSKPTLPLSIKIDASDLDADLQTELEKALKRRARKDGISLAGVLKKAEIDWEITCNLKD